ncbi:zinc finger CCHC domain-containing protein 9 isoform X2 [Chelonoidis abingdonii]|uniref:zinc finger CCHC domain-containing protein 9 isoform X2 n=1 Tax=Chelonoidis abingdonii TaxID=106734 RepID=UPI003F49146D
MTRWARTSTTHSKKPLDATPWEDMKNGSTSGTVRNKQQNYSNPLSLKNDQVKKKNKKKKDYLNEDVNGFMEYLKQSSQVMHNGKVRAADSNEVREEVATALKKDRRREGRRLKRQEMKKNTMVCFHCRKPGHGIADCPAALESQDMGTGICYRCGSTEHEITKCRAKVDPALGGCCRLCGSVEHFKKDCPENQNSDQAVTVGRWSYGMSADYEEILESPKLQKPKVKVPKVVNF